MARLHYLTRTDHSRRAARDAGLAVTDRTPRAWLDEKRRPSSANLDRIEAAYHQVRRQNRRRVELFGPHGALRKGEARRTGSVEFPIKVALAQVVEKAAVPEPSPVTERI